jgi:hypothetical protein
MLRHACGFKLANDGHDTRSMQHYLGHKNIHHTVRYTELSPDRFHQDVTSRRVEPTSAERAERSLRPVRSLKAQGQFTRIGVVEQRPGTPVQHVGIDAARPQKQDAAFPRGALGSETGKFAIQLRNLLVKVLLRPQAAIAGIGVHAEIADHYAAMVYSVSTRPRGATCG